MLSLVLSIRWHKIMADISLRGLDDNTAKRLKSEARRRGLSVNTFVIQLIRQGIGLRKPENRQETHHDLDSLAGTWSEDEVSTFLKAVADFEQIDEALWR